MKQNLFSQAGQRCAFVAPRGIATLLLIATVLLAGCTSDTQTRMSEEDKANFKGGPIPADYKDPHMKSNNSPASANATPRNPGVGSPVTPQTR